MKPWSYDGLVYRRRPTRTVRVGDVALGSDHPIRVQSMTTPSTKDTAATVEQIVRLVEAGCEIVRVTVPTTADADNLPNIRHELERRRLRVPLVADIHFTPAAAMKAVEHVEKVRINPGNYADKKKFNVREYTDVEYDAELERIERVFAPLVERAKQLGVAMRIGTNHGSLSDRIMNRYGDTPEGMVESALEFVRICESRGYRDLVLSMKSSNPVVVQQVYRLLATKMAEEAMDYPFHLGVTEAGDGEDGRVKSAIGIGALLDEGLGDTVRVSLTEDPVAEIPVAQRLVAPYNRMRDRARDERARPIELRERPTEQRDPHRYERRRSSEVRVGPHRLGGDHPVAVEVPLHSAPTDHEGLRRELDAQAGPRVPAETRAEVVTVAARDTDDLAPLAALRASMALVAPRIALSIHVDPVCLVEDESIGAWVESAHRLHLPAQAPLTAAYLRLWGRLLTLAGEAGTAVLAELDAKVGTVGDAVDIGIELGRRAAEVAPATLLLALGPDPSFSPLHAYRLLAARLAEAGLDVPLVLLDRPTDRHADTLLGSASALGGLLCDGIGDSVQIHLASAEAARRQTFNVLQAARVRITRTEFISCPSCGRTLFDLEETTARIKSRTAHLKGVKIAVMGCIVNGPGEMADADFGYVGWGEDKIALFVGKDMVAKDIPTAAADERLIELIKRHGKWIEPPVPAVG